MAQHPDDTYFKQLNAMLQAHVRAIPFLLVDLDILDQNIEVLKSSISDRVDYRIVIKSLPSIHLVEYVMQRAETNKLMAFHQPFLTQVAQYFGEEVDVLMGKPMPIKTAKYFYDSLSESKNAFDPFCQVQWLVDTTKRITEYIDLAKSLDKKLRLNLEIDVGLHRGGFNTTTELAKALDLIKENSEYVMLSGLMGYDPHIVKMPKLVRSQTKSFKIMNDFYTDCKDLIKDKYPSLWSEHLTFNGAGSPTINLHKEATPLNDISAGSCLVKPTTFDIDSLLDYQPSSFIATPVIKKFIGTQIPGLEKMKSVLNLTSRTNQQSYFIYGGFWKADYCSPKGLKQNAIYGASTNQTMVNTPSDVKLDVDDFVFLRPHQSEFVFLQFGKILAIRNFEIVEEWAVLDN